MGCFWPSAGVIPDTYANTDVAKTESNVGLIFTLIRYRKESVARCTICRCGHILQERYIGEMWKGSSDTSLNYRPKMSLIWVSVIHRNNKARNSMISVPLCMSILY